MSYLDRLEPLVYTSPKKRRFTLEFDDLVMQSGKKAGINEYPYQDLPNVQDMGNSIRRFPITCYITGVDYDKQADLFREALEENGRGILDHPRWGSFDVLPVSYEQREGFVNDMRRAVFTIEFIEFPEPDFILLALVKSAIAFVRGVINAVERVIAIVDSARRFVQGVSRLVANTINELNRVKGRFTELSSEFKGKNKTWLEKFADQRNQFNKLESDFQNNLDAVAGEPLQLLQEFTGLLSYPSRIQASIQQKIDSYKSVIDKSLNQLNAPNTVFTPYEASLQGATIQLIGTYLADTSIVGEITTRNDAVRIANDLQEYKNLILNALSECEKKGGTIDYEANKNLVELYSIAINRLLQQALNLPNERTRTIQRETPLLIAVWEIYGNIDNVDFFVSYNNLIGLENMILPRGRVVRFI